MRELFEAMRDQAQEDLALGLGNTQELNAEITELTTVINKLN